MTKKTERHDELETVETPPADERGRLFLDIAAAYQEVDRLEREVLEKGEVLKKCQQEVEESRQACEAAAARLRDMLRQAERRLPGQADEAAGNGRRRQDGEDTKVTLKDVVVGLLRRAPDGMTMRQLHEGVKDAIRSGQYKSSSKAIGKLIAQALTILSKQHAISKQERTGHKSLYKLTA